MKPVEKPETLTVTVMIMGKEYAVNCPPEEHEALVASAEFVNERMMGIKKRGRALDAERIAVMSALNLARELLAAQGDSSVVKPDEAVLARISQMGRDLDGPLDEA